MISEIYNEKILYGLPEKCQNAKAYCIKETPSTNTIAKELAKACAVSGTTVIADRQTAGRGRRGRSFFSPDGGIYLSMIWNEESKDVPYTVIAASAVCRVLRRHGVDAGIKWVNDIYVNSKKVCGILCERVPTNNGKSAIVIGIGINHSVKSFPDELKNIAASLELEDVSRQELAKEIIGILGNALCKDNFNAEKQYYAENMLLYKKSVRFEINGTEFRGTVEGLGNDEELIIRKDDGETVRLTSGMVFEA